MPDTFQHFIYSLTPQWSKRFSALALYQLEQTRIFPFPLTVSQTFMVVT